MIPRHVPALALGTLALGVAEFSMMSILLPVADDLGVTVPEAGHFISAYAAGVCAGVLIMAAAARKMPLKTLLLIIVGIITLGNTLTVFVGSYHLMLLSRFIAGLPHGAYFGAAGVLCTQLAEPGKASRDMCLMVAGMTIANLAGVPLASFLAWAVSWRAAFAIAAAAALITFSAIRITVPKVPALPDSGFAAQFRFLRSLEPWLVLGAIGLGNGGFFAYYSYVNPVMEHVAAVPASMMSVVITLAGAGMVLGNLFCAKISSSFSDESLAAAGQGVLLLSLASVFFLAHWSPAAIALTTLAARRWLRIFHFRPRTGPDDPQRQRRPAACRITRSGILQRRQRRRCVARRFAHRCGQSCKLGGYAGIFSGTRGFWSSFCQLAYSQSARRGTHRWPHRCTSRSDPVKNALAKAYCADCSPPIPNGLGRRILASLAALSVFRSLTSSRRVLRRRALPPCRRRPFTDSARNSPPSRRFSIKNGFGSMRLSNF